MSVMVSNGAMNNPAQRVLRQRRLHGNRDPLTGWREMADNSLALGRPKHPLGSPPAF